MKKSGFTLSELLISMAIIGTVSVLIAPFVSNIVPDKNKTRVLKYHSLIQKYTNDMLENELIYYTPWSINTTTGREEPSNCEGLSCTNTPLEASGYNYNRYSGAQKYPLILADMLGLSNVSINNNVVTGSMPDSSLWTIRPINATGHYLISIDMNGNNNGPNLSYKKSNPNKCEKPDIFIFRANRGGIIEAGDALTETFLKNPQRTSKKEDLIDAKAITKVYQ